MASKDEPVLEGEIVQTWQSLSEDVLRARISGHPTTLNERLLDDLRADRDTSIAPLLALWAADSARMERRFADAVRLYREHDELFARPAVAGLGLRAHALDQQATCHLGLGNLDAAMQAYELLAQTAEGVGRALYLAGQAAERAGRRDAARAAYRRAAAARNSDPVHRGDTADRARRAMARMDRSEQLIARPSELAEQLATALARRDVRGLRRLASPTHFSVGFAGAERQFVDADAVLELLEPDLRVSTTRVEPRDLAGSGGKRYLITEGWTGTAFRDRVSLLLTSAPGGWEWSGLVLHLATQTLLDRLLVPPGPAPEPPEPTTELLEIKAPWPADQSFRAGGFGWYLIEQAGVLLQPWTLIPLAAGNCGFGPAGFYYNFASHQDHDAFAIDFTRYRRFVPYDNVSGDTPVLAVAAGIVGPVNPGATNRDPDNTNLVEVRHTRVERTGPFQLPMVMELPYESRYLHLAGPNRIPVSPGMYVRRGARLGAMDDTGNSTLDHLHFCLHDDRTGGASVPPTPLDGVAVLPGDGGQCITSTNVPFP